jgi:hypothetical protein
MHRSKYLKPGIGRKLIKKSLFIDKRFDKTMLKTKSCKYGIKEKSSINRVSITILLKLNKLY